MTLGYLDFTPLALKDSGYVTVPLRDVFHVDADEMFWFEYPPPPGSIEEVNGVGRLWEIHDYDESMTGIYIQRGRIELPPETPIYYRPISDTLREVEDNLEEDELEEMLAANTVGPARFVAAFADGSVHAWNEAAASNAIDMQDCHDERFILYYCLPASHPFFNVERALVPVRLGPQILVENRDASDPIYAHSPMLIGGGECVGHVAHTNH